MKGKPGIRTFVVSAAWLACCGLVMAASAAAQAPAIGPGSAEDAVRQKQRQADVAFRDLQQAQYEAKLAEQDLLNAPDAAQAASPQQAEERKRQLDQARKAFAAARAKVEQARKRYEAALTAVDEAFQKPSPK
jgi:Skp family chaperone for outer membrane proteins